MGGDFFSDSIEGKKKAKSSLDEYIASCNEEGVPAVKEEDTVKPFTLRYPSRLDAYLTTATAAHNISKNQ
ncbi:toxin-antitoxin system HicB family antitoxin [Providencia rettgeri]|uniref:toxin-antitoxin system HicB family antitoxin n=1 Tax=Providencia rettgeri TaxID=587 RepID=UPI0034E06414